MRKFLPFILLCVISYKLSYSQGGVLNNGATIVITASTSMYVAGGTANGNYKNQTNGTDGAIDIDGDMYVEGNWTNNATGNNVFINRDGDGTVRLNGAAVQAIGGAAATFFENLNLTNADKILTVTGNSVSTSGTLTIDAVLDLSDGAGNGKTFIVRNKATTAITLVSDYIKSETTDGLAIIQWNINDGTGSYVVPFKNAAVEDVSITQNVTVAGDAAGVMRFTTYHTDMYGKPFLSPVTWQSPWVNVVDRYWGATSLGYTTQPTATMTLKYSDSDLNLAQNTGITSEASLFIQRYNPATNGWQTGGGSSTPASNLVSRVGVTAYGVMIASMSTSPLPIELTAFDVACIEDNKKTEITWTTASETNNDYFTLEKSRDGITYEPLANVPSQNGNSTIEQNYSYIDAAPYNGITYYQLKQTDYNGDSETSAPILADCIYDSDLPEVYNITYHAESGNVTFEMSSPVEGATSYYVSCYDVKGDRLVQESKSLTKGQNSINLNTRLLNRGIYFVSFMNDTYSGAKKFIVN